MILTGYALPSKLFTNHWSQAYRCQTVGVSNSVMPEGLRARPACNISPVCTEPREVCPLTFLPYLSSTAAKPHKQLASTSTAAIMLGSGRQHWWMLSLTNQTRCDNNTDQSEDGASHQLANQEDKPERVDHHHWPPRGSYQCCRWSTRHCPGLSTNHIKQIH